MHGQLFESPLRYPDEDIKDSGPDWRVEERTAAQLAAFETHGNAAALPLFSSSTTDEKISVSSEAGYATIAGVDEAGRGPLAGPVVAAAVILDRQNLPIGLNDSKKLSETSREILFSQLITRHEVGIASSCPKRIDQANILQANLDAMRRAVLALNAKPVAALIDGRDIPQALPCHAVAVIKGDAISLSIAAASIVAKVVRDRMMLACDADEPGYTFAKNKGYGTSQHLQAISKLGGCRHHRRSFAPLREIGTPTT